MNSFGEVVSWSYTSGYTSPHAFFYDRSAMKDLNNLIPAGSSWELNGAFGINDAGQIAGSGTHNGSTRAFLLTPIYKAFVQQPINADAAVSSVRIAASCRRSSG